MFNNVAVLTSKDSWFVPYAKRFVKILRKCNFSAKLFFKHEDISGRPDVVFVLSYFRIIKEDYLKKHKHNIVVHGSNLPKGKGWSPLFWQILEGKNNIPITLFEATEKMDAGPIYIKNHLKLEGHELNEEIRAKQAEKSIELCLKFIDKYEKLKKKPQVGRSTFYRKRTPKDSELDINKSLKDQFNLLRIVNNSDFPAFFLYRRHKYMVKIFKENDNKDVWHDKRR